MADDAERPTVEELASFFREMWDMILEGGEIDFENFTDAAMDRGLIVSEPYDPEGKHKDMKVEGDTEPGEPIFVLSPKMMPAPPNVGRADGSADADSPQGDSGHE